MNPVSCGMNGVRIVSRRNPAPHHRACGAAARWRRHERCQHGACHAPPVTTPFRCLPLAEPSNQIFVSNLSWGTSSDNLADHFAQVGVSACFLHPCCFFLLLFLAPLRAASAR